MLTRAQIIEILEGKLNVIEDRETEDNSELHHALKVLITGLKALEGGDDDVRFCLAPLARATGPGSSRRRAGAR